MRHNFVIGLQQDESRDSNFIWRLADPASAFNPLAPPPEVRLTISRNQLLARTDLRQGTSSPKSTNRGAFVIDQIKALDNRLTVLGGVRHDRIQGDFKRTTPQLGTTYEVRKGLYVYGLYSESFVPNAPRFDQGLNLLRSFDPTESRGYDFGFKAELLEGRLSGSVAFFNIERSNVVQAYPAVPVPPGIPQFFLSGLEGSEGVEVEIFYAPAPAWQFIFSYARTDARILESNRPTDIGLQLAQTSPHSFSVTGKHSVLRGPLKGLSVGGMLMYRRGPIPAFSTFANRLLRDDSWDRLDLFVAYDARFFGMPTKISLNVNNATDSVYYERQGMFNAPRQVFVQSRWRF
jgi:iron complex outermembrane receptor protein